MHLLPSKRDRKKLIRGTYLATFFFTFHFALLVYVNSSFASRFISPEFVGLLYVAGSVIAIALLGQMSPLLNRFGNFRVTIALLLAILLALFGLVSFKAPFVVITFFVLYQALIGVSRINFDIDIDELSGKTETGRVRGVYLTVINIAIAISPFVVGRLVRDGDYRNIFLLAMLMVAISIAVVATKLKKVPDASYDRGPFLSTIKEVWRQPDIFRIFMASFLLQFFFAWMVIYTPIYLTTKLGFSWESIGIIFTIMLLPFVFFELPLGWLADKKYGEKEFLVAGFIIMALAAAALSFISIPSVVLWAVVLFLSRIGASFVEIMSETYFFKKISAKDSNTIEFFADSRPLPYVIAPAIASIFLSFYDLRWLFLFLGVIMLAGVWFAARLKDTR